MLLVTNAAFSLFFAVLFYVPVCLISFRRLIPRLSATSKRIAISFLVAQILVIVLSIAIRPASAFEDWLWRLHGAANIPSTLASTQLVAVGVVALSTAWLASERPPWQRLYLVSVGFVFLYVSLDDFFDLKVLEIWLKEPFLLTGIGVTVSTIAVAMHSPRRARIWHVCLLTGLFLAAMGGLVIDGVPDQCGNVGFLRIDECLQLRFLEELLEFVGFWLTLVAMLGHLSEAAPSPRPRIRLILYAIPVFCCLLFAQHALLPNLSARLVESQASVQSRSSAYQAAVEGGQQVSDEAQVGLDESALSAVSSAARSAEPATGGKFAVSNEKLLYAFIFLLYVPVGLFSSLWLFPHLTPQSARLAVVLLAAQILAVVLSVGIRQPSEFVAWLWNLSQEWNIPSTLASTQLALVAGYSLATAWLAKAKSGSERLYLVGLGLVFLFLAWDEYFTFHEHIANWERYYAALGAAVALATAALAFRSPRRTQIWRFCLLTGLAIGAIGAMAFNGQQRICGSFGFVPLYGCLWPNNYGETLEFLGIWLVLVAILISFSQSVPTPSPRVRRVLYLLPAFWILFLIHNSFVPSLELRLLAQPSSVQFESGVGLHGYRIENRDGATALWLYTSAKRRDYVGKGYSVHLVDQVSGNSVASHDRHASRQDGLLFAPGHAHIYRQWLEVEIPPATPANRAMWIILTVWHDHGDEYARQSVIASDLQTLSASQVILTELVIPAEPAIPPAETLARFDNGFALDEVTLPDRARAGETLSIAFTWRSEVEGDEDHAQFLHLGHVESGEWWVYDQQPLGARLPTRLWYSGLADSETWQVPLPDDLAPGRYEVLTGLYRVSDKERAPVTDADGRPWLDNRVALGSLIVK